MPEVRTDGAPTPDVAEAGAAAATATEEPVADDSGELEPGDRVVLIVESDPGRARALLEAVHDRGAKALLASRSTASLGLAREHRPAAVLLSGDLPRAKSVLGQLKKHPDTRHLPVVLIGDPAARVEALRAGAAAFVDEPLERAALDDALDRIDRVAEVARRRIALVSAEGETDEQLAGLLAGGHHVELDRVQINGVLAARRERPFDLGVVIVGRQRSEALSLLREVATDEALRDVR